MPHDEVERKHKQGLLPLRNSRGGNNPDVLKAAIDAQRFGADGVTVHPRPDERHIRYSDVRAIRKIITTEFNIEGNCREQKFIDLVLEVKPHQVTPGAGMPKGNSPPTTAGIPSNTKITSKK